MADFREKHPVPCPEDSGAGTFVGAAQNEFADMSEIIAAVEMGIWHIELVEGEAPKLLSNATMLKLLGLADKADSVSPAGAYEFWYSRIKPEAVESVAASVAKMCTGERDENTYLWIHPELGERYVRCGGTAYEVPGGYVLRGYHYDVDDIVRDQQKQEKRLQKSLLVEKAHSEVISALSTIYTTIFNANLITHEYEIINSVRLMKETIPRKGDFEEVKEQILAAFMAPDMIDDMREFLDIGTLSDRLRESNTIVCEYRNPENRWFQARFIVKSRLDTGEVRDVLYVACDFTEEKLHDLEQQAQLRETLAAKEDKIQVIGAFSSIYKEFCVLNLETKQFHIEAGEYWERQRKKIEGSFDDLIGMMFAHNLSPEYADDPDAHAYFDLNSLGERLKDRDVISREFKDIYGAWFAIVFIVKERAEDGRVVEVLFAAQDVDDQKRKELEQEAALKDALMVARHASRAKSSFLSNMSHDIRTPLNAIIGFTALAQTHIDETEQVQDYLGKIHTSSEHLLSLINEILDMSRIESGAVKLEEGVVHMPEVLHDLRILIQGQIAAKRQHLYIDTQDVMDEDVVTDKLRLNQILINIVSNAIKYTPNDGDIIIRIAEKPSSLKGYVTYVFDVKDNGIGMSSEFVDHIFDDFARENTSTVSGIQGTGLGMSITKNIIDLMNGSIEVKSELGKGSEFVVTLDFKVASQPVVYRPRVELLGAKVLVVDDDINTCQSVSKMLREIQMRPQWTTSGKEAIVRAQEAADIKDEYKAYIIDYLMPDMNGIETVRRIRRVIGDEAPIIVLTAYDWTSFEDEAREAGVTAFVEKPLFMSELKAVLSEPVELAPGSEQDALLSCDFSGKRILLAEDNDLNREIAAAILEDFGFEVDAARDGVEAIELLADSAPDRYDLILMDIQMPRMDGYAAAREIRSWQGSPKASIPIVAMTANAFEEDRQLALAAGMNDHIAKPIDPKVVAETLSRVFVG
ncbi:MAG: response regulator [Coriobacteriia bacterium]|nr:response regulator [Coriobacteriia bacterium]